MNTSGDSKRLLVLVLAVSVVALAGCGMADQTGNGGSDTEDGREYPEVVEKTTASLSEENASAFLAAITDDSGALTAEGQAWVDRLETVETLGAEQRDAVARSIVAGGLGDQRLARLDGLLASPAETRRTVLRDGLRDTSGDGLLDGETRLLGLDRTEQHPTVSAAARKLSDGGYNDTGLAYLDQLSTHADSEFRLAQIRGFGLVNQSVANGSVTAAERQALADSSGDGLLDGTATHLGVAPGEAHPTITGLAVPLSDGGYSETELAYLAGVSNASKNRSLWEQAAAVGLLNETAGDGTVSPEAVAGLDEVEGGLLAGFAAELGVENRTDNATVGRLAVQLVESGYGETELTFLERVANVTASRFQYEQARALSLLSQPAADGTVTVRDSDALLDSSGDGLLDPMAARLGADPATAKPRLGDLAEPLAAGGYDDTELAYLDRLEALSAYQGNEYERWAQAQQLGLLDDAVANGTITDDQLTAVRNSDTDHLLNGIEASFGTQPKQADTSGDGYPDHLVWGPMRELGLPVNPSEPDVYVELDTVRGQAPSTEDQLQDVTATFRTEPTDVGPINVHFFRCDSDRPTIDSTANMESRIDEDRTVTGLGFQYLLVTDGSIGLAGTEVAGVAFVSRQQQSWMAVDGTLSRRASATHEASAIAHELGHSLGLLESAFEGIDSRAYSDREYESIMNYNLWTPVTFSTGPPFDDYQRMAEQSFGSYHQDTSRLETMWETGPVEKSVGCQLVDT